MIFSYVILIPEASAATVYPTQYTYVKAAPYWTCSPFDEFGTSQSVTILEKDYNFYYIEYTKGGVLKRGYVPQANFSGTGYSWCSHKEFNPGYNNTSSSVTVYYGPGTSYGVFGSIDADEGESVYKPLLVLGYNSSYAYVQYVTNPNPDSSTHSLFKRGWVLASKISINRPTATYDNNEYMLISSNNDSLYLTAVVDTSADSGYSVKMMAATGNKSQQWKAVKCVDANNGAVYYKIVSVSTGLCLQVSGKIPVVNVNVILTTITSPDKSQEFQFSGNLIKTRCSGSFMCLKESGTKVIQSRSTSAATESWSIHTIDKFWNNAYTSGSRKLSCYYGAGYTGNITSSVVDLSIAAWNNIANISVTKTTSSSSADIVIVADKTAVDFAGRINPKLTASTSFLTNPTTSQLNSSWYKVQIQLNLNSAATDNYLATQTASTIRGVITHELGHALKLQHPHGENTRIIHSNMNQGFYTSHPTHVPFYPSEYDERSLIQKWSAAS